jgi:uncharacterized membrane protein YvbJ
MVYCAKCGTKNDDDAKVCSNCGAPLYSTRERPEHYRRMEDECFGIPRGGTIVGVFIGLIILFAGISLFLNQPPYNINIPWWSLAVILFGLLIIVSALYGRRRRY